MANYHPSGVAEEVAETSSNTQSAFRRPWKKYGVKRHQHAQQRFRIHDSRRTILQQELCRFFL